MNKEHVSEQLLAGYVRGDDGLAGDEVWAVEAHLEKCAECRSALSALSLPTVSALVDDVWAGLGPKLAEAGPSPMRRRWAGRLHTWVTPVMLPWLVMIVLIPALGFLLDSLGFTESKGYSFVQLFSPVLPVLGVAVSWAKGLDPAYELVTSTPRAGLYLLLRRTTAVLAVVLPIQGLSSWLAGGGFGLGLLPSLAFTTGTLALGGVIGVTRAAYVLTGVWMAVILAPAVASQGRATALEPRLLPVWGAIFALTAVVVVLRQSVFGLLTGSER
ncbi:zf-HC2 domain-containing protein [Amycolatopsis roodepoortensis]|uniref:zf-HC2 domain-containing protein n=1 Tax=Amycolatopsis roodepoortensis TaxID=700274 RepID=UPI00214CD376|nr:zf-HC2 domain-containing protein [Amycolatopsis roodepoortensis]UUV29205.1 zf-HC2 domain-containing protein [Amycolatopsis roodepoortensis]